MSDDLARTDQPPEALGVSEDNVVVIAPGVEVQLWGVWTTADERVFTVVVHPEQMPTARPASENGLFWEMGPIAEPLRTVGSKLRELGIRSDTLLHAFAPGEGPNGSLLARELSLREAMENPKTVVIGPISVLLYVPRNLLRDGPKSFARRLLPSGGE